MPKRHAPLKEYSIGALSLAASRLFRTPVKAEGQDPVSKMDNSSISLLQGLNIFSPR
jgi:hypothetical protein